MNVFFCKPSHIFFSGINSWQRLDWRSADAWRTSKGRLLPWPNHRRHKEERRQLRQFLYRLRSHHLRHLLDHLPVHTLPKTTNKWKRRKRRKKGKRRKKRKEASWGILWVARDKFAQNPRLRKCNRRNEENTRRKTDAVDETLECRRRWKTPSKYQRFLL